MLMVVNATPTKHLICSRYKLKLCFAHALCGLCSKMHKRLRLAPATRPRKNEHDVTRARPNASRDMTCNLIDLQCICNCTARTFAKSVAICHDI
jgi:hypothetical protein